MTVKQTRCPFCQSAFYITTLQLNAYRGQARCGQCHQVFDANANMVSPQTAQLQSATYGTQPNTATRTQVSAPSVNSPAKEAQTTPVELTQTVTEDNTPVPAVKEDILLFSDDTGIDDEDEANTVAPPIKKPDAIILDGTFDQHFLDNTFEDMDVLKKQELNDVEKLHAAADDSWINDLLKEEEQEQKAIAEAAAEAAVAAKTVKPSFNKLPDTLIHRPKSDHEEDLLSFLNRTGAVTLPSSHHQTDNTNSPKPASNRILKPTTVRYSPFYFLGWGFMSLLMLGLLIGQYVYFNFEQLATDPKTSGYIHQVCTLTGCQLPYMNADELHVKQVRLIARNHAGQTTFRAVLTNSAKLSQPFPALRLNLKDNGITTASLIIQPREYLPENLKTLTRLATKTPYPVEFTIKRKRATIKDFSLEAQYH